MYNECVNYSSEFRNDCGRRNPGDTRYCEYCGSETILFAQGLLLSWEELISAHGSVRAGISRVHSVDALYQDDDEVAVTIDSNDLPL